ncbi:MAG: HupE/UreJ family protein [Pseudomonadota bacterium]
MTRSRKSIALMATLAALLPSLALAHPGHGSDGSFAAGLLHPLDGLDHLLVIGIAGMLAARLGAHSLRVLVALFAGLLVAALTSALGAWQFAAGFLVTSVCLITIVATATRICQRFTAAAGSRSSTLAWTIPGRLSRAARRPSAPVRH